MFPSHDTRSYQLWWIPLDMGGYDGFELRRNGDLYLLNWDLFVGKRWWMEGNVLHMEYTQRAHVLHTLGKPERIGKVLHMEHTVQSHTPNELVLTSLSLDQMRTDKYIYYPEEADVDPFYGHWHGPGGSYVQVITINDFYFQVVFSPNDQDKVAKYEGIVRAGSAPMEFRMNEKKVALRYTRSGDTETLEAAGVLYTREKQ